MPCVCFSHLEVFANCHSPCGRPGFPSESARLPREHVQRCFEPCPLCWRYSRSRSPLVRFDICCLCSVEPRHCIAVVPPPDQSIIMAGRSARVLERTRSRWFLRIFRGGPASARLGWALVGGVRPSRVEWAVTRSGGRREQRGAVAVLAVVSWHVGCCDAVRTAST